MFASTVGLAVHRTSSQGREIERSRPNCLWGPRFTAMEGESSRKATQGDRAASSIPSSEYHTMRSLAIFLLFVSLVPGLASAQCITVKGNRFQVDGKEIWISVKHALEEVERFWQ